MKFEIYLQLSAAAMVEKEERVQIFECLKNKKSFLNEIKSIFNNF